MSDIQSLERDIKAAEELVARREMALKLESNREFRKLFIEGYFLHDAARLVQTSTEPRISEDARQQSLEEARATGYMRRHLSDIVQMGWTALNQLPSLRAELEEARAQEHADSYGDVAQSNEG